MSAAKRQHTEAEMLRMLKARHGERAGNGEAYAFIPKVRSAAGFDSRRTIDAMAMTLWPSRGLLLDAFEIKCSRSDWLREMKMPEKAEEFARVCDRFWLVVGDREIVRPGELPEGWGLLVARGRALVCESEAKHLHADEQVVDVSGRSVRKLPPAVNRSFLAALLREAVRQGDATPDAIRAAVEAAVAQERERRDHEIVRANADLRELQEKVAAFERASGVRIADRWQPDAGDIGRAVRLVLDGDNTVARMGNRLEAVADSARRIAEEADANIKALERAA